MKFLNKKGFTLGELLIVVGIVSALTAVGTPAVMSQIDKAKLKVDQTHVLEAKSMASAQYAADHEDGEVVYYYNASDSTIHKWTSDGIQGYGKSKKEPYRSETKVTETNTYPVVDGVPQLVCVKISGSTIQTSWQPMNASTPEPTPTPTPGGDSGEITIPPDITIKVRGSWPVPTDFHKDSDRIQVEIGMVYTFENEYYLCTSNRNFDRWTVTDSANSWQPWNAWNAVEIDLSTASIYSMKDVGGKIKANGDCDFKRGDIFTTDSGVYVRTVTSIGNVSEVGTNAGLWVKIEGTVFDRDYS